MKMTKKDIKYGLLFQNKLSSKPGSHMSVSVMFGNSTPGRVATYVVACEHKHNIFPNINNVTWWHVVNTK